VGHGAHIAKLKSPELRDCANPKCDYSFWGYGIQKFCSVKCRREVDLPKLKERMKKWRKNHPEKYKEANRKSNLKKKERQNEISK